MVCLLAAAAFPALTPYLLVMFVGNLAGSVGDPWTAFKLLRFTSSEDSRVVDEITGVTVCGRGARFERAVMAVAPAWGRRRRASSVQGARYSEAS
jgi:hypothetical protein